VLTNSATPFKVFTPYKNAWLKSLQSEHYQEYKVGKNFLEKKSIQSIGLEDWGLEKIGFKKQSLIIPAGTSGARELWKKFHPHVEDYQEARNFPAKKNYTSSLSTHLRFGTISIRSLVRFAINKKDSGSNTWLSELIWRDFYQMILANFPHVEYEAFKKEYASIRWPGKESHFEAWCKGETGYPMVDAAMRHFNDTGWVHNRLRMVVAMFLTKDLLIDWRKGEEYFAANLLDFDLAANNGGWQWSASTGCDAQPYFRIFNPISQSEKFDPDGLFIKEHLPELKNFSKKDIHWPHDLGILRGKYPEPIVDHSEQREKALALFKK
jgi:deoxyribodipyrimidine photo-lyase